MDENEDLSTGYQRADTSSFSDLIGCNVPVNTSLPPQVEGHLRCFLCICISQIKWIIHQHPAKSLVRITWWGETGSGAIFRPFDGSKKDNNNLKTTARYPIRSGPKQFKSYLNDMNVLLLDILDEDSSETVGYAEVNHIATLSTYSPLKNTYMVYSLADEKIAELHVSVTLEPLMESYDSSGFLPTVDISNTPMFQTTKPDLLPERISARNSITDISSRNVTIPSSYTSQNAVPMSRRSTIAASNNPQKDTTVSITTGGDVVFMQNGFAGEKVKATGSDQHTHLQQTSIQGGKQHIGDAHTWFKNVNQGGQSSQNTNGQNLISILLEKGNKLRKTMVLSMADELTNKPEKRNWQNSETSLPISRSNSYGSLLREILNTEDCAAPNEDSEDRVINLVLGPEHEELVFKNPDESSVSSLEMNESDFSDPLHESDILQDLFYTNQLDVELLSGREKLNDSMSALQDSGNEREVSRRSLHSDHCEDLNMEKSLKSSIQEKSKVLAKPKHPSQRPKTVPTKPKTTAKSKPLPKPKTLSRPKSPSCRSKSPVHAVCSPRSKVTMKVETSPKIKKSPQGCTKKKTKLKKLKRRGSGSGTASGSDMSDTDSVSTCYSGSSRVSFDMAPSDAEEADKENAPDSKVIDGVSMERLTLLYRATVARVAVDVLNLIGTVNVEKKSAASNKSNGKPPKPRLLPQKSNSYFLEYQFPVVAAARDKDVPNTMATEVTRAVAKKVTENTINFSHQSVFPLLFDGKSFENWWKSVINFKIYSRTTEQKNPSLIGCSQLPLKSILKAENLCLKTNLLVCKPGKQSGLACSSSNTSSQLGHLKVSVDIGSDTADFGSALSRTRIAELNGKSKIIPIVTSSSKQNPIKKQTEQFLLEPEKASAHDADMPIDTAEYLTNDHHEITETNHNMESKLSLPIYPDKFKSAAYQRVANVHQTPFDSYQNPEDLEPLALNSLLIIKEGRKISTLQQNVLHAAQDPTISQGQRQSNMRNIYIQCRMFWCDQTISSSVCWGTSDPQFNFVQVSPVLITPNLLERMRNNYLVIEVWDRKTITQDEELVGIVKLSLHQFYLSLRNKRIISTLLKAQYPIIAHDCFVPIVDPLSNNQRGQLKVLLAIGSVEQVSTLQRVTLERYMSVTHENETSRNIDTIGDGDISKNNLGECFEHLFEIVIEDINHMPQFEEVTWGETDCFIQYFFPFQQKPQFSEKNSEIGSQATLKPFRTATTLCIPDPSFQSITRHKLSLYPAIPVQTQLLNAFVDNEGNITELSFELWGRFYHPNVRDKVLAKATLPLVKLFAMVSMYKKEPLLQSFNLPFVLEKKSNSADLNKQNNGNLNITITYKCQLKRSSAKLTKSQTGSSSLYISVGLLRICGLQAAAEYCASFDSSMQYPSEIGVNTYIKTKLSFIHDRTCTSRTFARNFCPEVSQFFEFHCPLINEDSCSLAESLESAELFLEFWHQVPADLETNSHLTTFEDVLLGVTEVPLIGLLTKKTGIQGWLPIHRPASGTFRGTINSSFTNQLEYVMGGIEVKVNFTHSSDQERLLHAADTVGWNLPEKYLLADNFEDFEDGMVVKVTINIDEVNLAKKNCLFPEQTANSISQCYLKYIFHDKGPFVSKPLPFRIKGKDFLFSKDSHQNSFQLFLSSSLIWYLKEEAFEVQLWCGSGGGHDFHRQSDRKRDKWIASAWIPLSGLCHGQKKNVHRISGIHPMFKAGLPNLHGMYIRAHISLQHQKVQDEELATEESSVLESDWNDSFLVPDANDFINTFHVHISIERAMHLVHIKDKSTDKLCQPNAYVSFTTAQKKKMAFTNVMFDDDSPVWEYELDTILGSELLYEKNKHLVFKVWHKPVNAPKEPDKSSDQVIGFLSVDLSPLVLGLKQLCGWYNIIDFGGSCRGQVKLSVTPLESIAYHWNQLKAYNSNFQSDKSVSLERTLPHFNEHYQNVKLHHDLLHNQQQNQKTDERDYSTSIKLPIKSSTKNVAFSSESTSQLMSKLEKQMIGLDELNAHLKSKLSPFHYPTKNESVTPSISQRVSNPSSRVVPPVQKDGSEVTSNVDLVLDKQTCIGEDIYFDQFTYADKCSANDVNQAARSKEMAKKEKDGSLNSDWIHSEQLNDKDVHDSNHLFTAHPIGSLLSPPIPPPEWNDNYSDLGTDDPELVQIFTHQEIVDNSIQIERKLEKCQQIQLENGKSDNCFKDFADSKAERVYATNDDDDDDKDSQNFVINDDTDYDDDDDDDDDEANVVIPRIMNDVPYLSDQSQILGVNDQCNLMDSEVWTERKLLENITHNLTDKKPPDGLGIMPVSTGAVSDSSFNSASETSEIHTEDNVSQDLAEKFQLENPSPEIGKHMIFEEKLHLDSEPTVPCFPPLPVVNKKNAETIIDDMLSTDNNLFLEERLTNSVPGQSLSRCDLDVNELSLPDEKQLKSSLPPPSPPPPPPSPPKLANVHHVNKILSTNFFLPLADLEQSMKVVKLSTALQTYKSAMDSFPCDRGRTPNQKPVEKADKESKVPVKYNSLPTKKESQRIARIFSMKFS